MAKNCGSQLCIILCTLDRVAWAAGPEASGICDSLGFISPGIRIRGAQRVHLKRDKVADVIEDIYV